MSELEDGMNKLINNKCENESLTTTVKDMVQRFQGTKVIPDCLGNVIGETE